MKNQSLNTHELKFLRWSLVFVWLSTALVSVWEMNGQSLQLLTAAGVQNRTLAKALVSGGAALDAVLGCTLWIKPSRAAYLAALATMALMTLIATLIAPGLWLHPLGPLTKNVPIAVSLWLLAKAR